MSATLEETITLQMHPGMVATMLMKTIMSGPPGDLREDLWLLYAYGGRVDHITEFGVRGGVSTSAFLAAQPRVLRSYDIQPCPNEEALGLSADRTDWKFILRSSIDGPIEPTDLLFIDSLHTYEQLTTELDMHHENVSTYIILHDTITWGTYDEFGHEPGLAKAQRDFTERHPEWRLELMSLAQNGLSVLRRKEPK